MIYVGPLISTELVASADASAVEAMATPARTPAGVDTSGLTPRGKRHSSMDDTEVVTPDMVPPWGQYAMYECFLRATRLYVAYLVLSGQVRIT